MIRGLVAPSIRFCEPVSCSPPRLLAFASGLWQAQYSSAPLETLSTTFSSRKHCSSLGCCWPISCSRVWQGGSPKAKTANRGDDRFAIRFCDWARSCSPLRLLAFACGLWQRDCFCSPQELTSYYTAIARRSSPQIKTHSSGLEPRRTPHSSFPLAPNLSRLVEAQVLPLQRMNSY